MARATLELQPAAAPTGRWRAMWRRLSALALRINDSGTPLIIDRADRAELQRTIDG
jgi:hypothetical protein